MCSGAVLHDEADMWDGRTPGLNTRLGIRRSVQQPVWKIRIGVFWTQLGRGASGRKLFVMSKCHIVFFLSKPIIHLAGFIFLVVGLRVMDYKLARLHEVGDLLDLFRLLFLLPPNEGSLRGPAVSVRAISPDGLHPQISVSQRPGLSTGCQNWI
jgi:hypothetical protein